MRSARALVVLLFGLAVAAAGQPLDAGEAEELVRLTWYEGLPAAEARRIGPEGAERLAEMLADAAEAAHHGKILVALGHCGAPGAFEAIDAWAAVPRTGQVDRATFRAWQALPHALGYLADRDPRALGRLAGLLNAPAPTWSFGRNHGAELQTLQRRAAATSLAETGLPAAAASLRGGRSADPDFEAHLAAMRARHAERAAERLR